MVAMNRRAIPHLYDDGPGLPCARDKEQAYRQGFVEEARRVVREWIDADDDDLDPWGELATAERTRRRVRERFDTQPGHEVVAARARGRHHALAFVTQAWDEVSDLDTFDRLVMPAWLMAVERWAQRPIRMNTISPPPRPMEIEGADAVRTKPAQAEAKASTAPSPAPHPFALRVDALCLADVEPEPVRWLWPGRFALGKLSLIAGEPGLGKSFLTLDMAARVSRGDGWPCSGGDGEPGGVVLLSAEDDIKDTIVPRLIAADADRRRIQAMRALYQPLPGMGVGAEKPVPFSLIEHMPQLEQLIHRAEPCKLVIVDPVSAFLGSTDSHNNSEVRGVLAPLSEMAARHGVAIVAVTHLNKGQGSALYRVIGSIAFTAAARAAYVVTRDEDDPARRLMLPAKNNLGRDEDGFAYRLDGEPTPHVAWESMPVAMSADEAVGVEPRARGPEPDARRDAEDWLRDYLAAGPKPASEVFEAAKADGHSRITIKRAKAALGVESAKQEFEGRWVWILPGGGPVMTGGEGDHEEDQRCLPQTT